MKELSIIKFNDAEKTVLNESTLYDPSYPYALAKFIKECTPPITIALQGEWGSGKTTMMNMVKEVLLNSDVECLDFNPWLYSQFNMGDELPLILLTHLSQETGTYNKFKEFFSKVGVATINFLGKKAGGTDDIMNSFTPDIISQLKNLKIDFENAVKNKLLKNNKKNY